MYTVHATRYKLDYTRRDLTVFIINYTPNSIDQPGHVQAIIAYSIHPSHRYYCVQDTLLAMRSPFAFALAQS